MGCSTPVRSGVVRQRMSDARESRADAGRPRVRLPPGNIPAISVVSPGSTTRSSMRAVIYSGSGGPEVISIGEVPKPEVRPGYIRVRVHAAGLNRADLIQRRGQYAA